MSIIFIVSVFVTCKHEDNPIQHSTCKSFTAKSIALNKEMTSASSCVYYTYNATTQQLYIKHINAAFNCCPGNIYADVSKQNDTIFISEREEESQCDCMCLYDLELTVNSVETGTYVVKFIEPYVAAEVELSVTINLAQVSADTFCLARSNYPWGLFH